MALKATWIWYPGDYEIWLGNKMNNRRTERGAFFPPFWKQDSHYVTVEFSKKVLLQEKETLLIKVEGEYNIKIDGKMLFGEPKEFTLEEGSHNINIKVHNQTSPPAIFIQGKEVQTDSSWRVTVEDKEWIDDQGKASDTTLSEYMPVGFWNFSKNSPPSKFHLKRTRLTPLSSSNGLYDFGKETFGYINLHGLKGEGLVNIYYGESKEEAMDKNYSETLDCLEVKKNQITNLARKKTQKLKSIYTLEDSKAFRFVKVEAQGLSLKDVSMEYEYLEDEVRGEFLSSDEEINRIWDVSNYTMQLTTREFFIDGIKRDRWVWSGDASQSYLMNYYLFGDLETVKRTTWLLGGKEPITSHINTILDYTFYWLISIYDYYMYSGDNHFLEQIYPRMKSYMDFVLSRRDEDGMVQGLAGDWVFVDWADRPMDKKGELSFEQILFLRSLEVMRDVASLTNDEKGSKVYKDLASALREKLIPRFWDEEKGAISHNFYNGKLSKEIFRYPNIFAIIFGFLPIDKKERVKKTVILNDDILKITTPYMRFYELEALCMLGEQELVTKEIKSYWGGMLKEGATSFWEKYDSKEKGAQRYSMYGRPYGKSLCHAWGASPIYIFSKYYLGVRPTKPGFEEYSIKPSLGGFKWIEGKVPTPFGAIHVKMDEHSITVFSDGGEGKLILDDGKRVINIPPKSQVTYSL